MMPHGRPPRLAPRSFRSILIAFPFALALAGCATLGEPQGEALVPTRCRTETGPFVVFSNYPIAADAPTVRSLLVLESDIEATLGLRVRAEKPPIQVYILNDRPSFTHFMKYYYPELPPRRAFFLAQGAQRIVYTFRGERLDEDLRHEATHALLNVAVGDLPLWLDEGLAEYFEGPKERLGVNPEHLARLPQDLAEHWRPDLARLETLKNVRQMQPRDYRESWGWVHYLLNGSAPGKTALLAYLGDLRANPDAAPLSARLQGEELGSGATLATYLDRLRPPPAIAGAGAGAGPGARPTPPGAPVVRMQDASNEPVPRRAVFGWFRGLFSR